MMAATPTRLMRYNMQLSIDSARTACGMDHSLVQDIHYKDVYQSTFVRRAVERIGYLCNRQRYCEQTCTTLGTAAYRPANRRQHTSIQATSGTARRSSTDH